MQACLAPESICDEIIEDLALGTDKKNGAMWLKKAMLRAKDNDIDGTITALKQVINSNIFNEYYAEHIVLFERALLSFTELTHIDRKKFSQGMASLALGSGYQTIYQFCRERVNSSEHIAKLCIDTGKP